MKVICKLWRKAGDCPFFTEIISYERFKNFKYYVLVMQVQKGKAKLMISCNQLSIFIR